jgi:flagellar protein FlbD
VNPDLIERAESTPDTVITLTDGHKLVVSESLHEVIARIRHWRASVAASAHRLAQLQPEEDEATRGTDNTDTPPAPPDPEQLEDLAELESTTARVLHLRRREE